MNTEATHKYVNPAHAREEFQMQVMERIMQDDRCPFCREHLMEYHTEPIILETEHWILTKNFAPYKGADIHLLLITKQHCTGFWELSDEAKVDLFSVLESARTQNHMPGGTLVMRWGDTEYTRASVVHLHAHLIVGTDRSHGTGDIPISLGYQAPKQ